MGRAYLLLSVLKRVKGRSLFIIECIEVCKGEKPIYYWVYCIV